MIGHTTIVQLHFTDVVHKSVTVTPVCNNCYMQYNICVWIGGGGVPVKGDLLSDVFRLGTVTLPWENEELD